MNTQNIHHANELTAVVHFAEKCGVPLDSTLFWDALERVLPKESDIAVVVGQLAAMIDELQHRVYRLEEAYDLGANK